MFYMTAAGRRDPWGNTNATYAASLSCVIFPSVGILLAGAVLMSIIEKYSRFFVRHHLSFKPRHKNAHPIEFLAPDDEMDIRTMIDNAIENDAASLDVKVNDVVRLTKLEVREDDGIAIFLFRRSDPNTAAQVLENRKTLELRAVEIEPDEAPAVSAHLFMSLERQKLVVPTHRALMEEVPGLGRTYMHTILHDIVKGYAYHYTHKGQPRETYSVVKFEGTPSDTIGEALKGGSVPYVELIRPGEIVGLDATGVEPREQKMKVMIRVDKPGVVLETLEKVRGWMANTKWSEMRVRLDLPEDRSRLVSVARTENAKDVLFVRAVQVGTKTEIPSCTEEINEELVEKAQELFAKDD